MSVLAAVQTASSEVDFTDASTYYKVSTVNYLAAGSCNFNNSGVSLWPLNQIVDDTQYYVRDAVINYATAMGTIDPQIEGRLNFITDTDRAGDHDQLAGGAGLSASELPDPGLQRGGWGRRHHPVVRGAFGREDPRGRPGWRAGGRTVR